MSDFELSQRGKGRATLSGDMTIFHAQAMKQALLKQLGKGKQLDIDLSGVTEIDTTGIQLLLLMRREATKSGIKLQLLGHSPAVQQAIRLLRLEGELCQDPSLVWS